MIENNDWRLTGQEGYLKDKQLIFLQYQPWSKEWDHDHCEFCYGKFGLSPDDLHEGYSTTDKYWWICSDCYNDFKEMFNWSITSP